jgi:hypothetical protein
VRDGGDTLLGLTSPSRGAGPVSPDSGETLLIDYLAEEVGK